MLTVEDRPFLTAQWRHLAMVNYEVDPELVGPLVPRGTELDHFGGRYYVSLVGLLFLHVRLRGLRIPFHERFEEINLRFYVRRRVGAETRRAVVFVRELVRLPTVALIARWRYGEHYSALPMRHRVDERNASYEWRRGGRWQGLRVEAEEGAALPRPGSEEEFITEHYWGYSTTRRGTIEYRVEHPRWRVRRARASVDGDLERLYGPGFAATLSRPPTSAFLADGSSVAVMPGRLLRS
ncbi:MAG TPA: DUF2071 domain-containing protein [Candidatus Dormibacteraeota bacterium]|nr:DUF2071 domain-containing protein [Candidatus Dormibacteraeota bacterium]